MKSYIGRIALSGMRGRKKDTALTALVIILSFMFLTVSTILIASYTSTQEQQRYQLYGKWQALYAGQSTSYFDTKNLTMVEGGNGSNPTVEALFEETGCISESAVITNIGTAHGFGTVGTISGDFESLASLTLAEGRLPESPNEIAIESSQLAQLGADVGIGSEVTLEFEWESPVFYSNAGMDSVEKTDVLMAAFKKSWNDAKDEPYSIYSLNGLDTSVPFDELEDEVLDQAWSMFVYSGDYLNKYEKTLHDYGQYEDASWHVVTRKHLWYPNGGIGFGTPSSSAGSVGKEALEELLENGQVEEQRFYITKTMTVCGIVNTYSDRWDTNVSLPNALVLHDVYTQFGNIMISMDDILVTDNAPLPSTRIYLMASNGLETAEFYTRLKDAFENGGSPDGFFHVSGGYSYEYDENYFPTLVDAEKPGTINRVYDTQSKSIVTLNYTYDDESGCYIVEGRTPISIPFDGFFHSNFAVGQRILIENGYLPQNYLIAGADSAFKLNDSPICINRSAYPQETILGRSVNNLIIGIISIITICAVFQIFITQLNRRTGRLTTLKSIGASNGQVVLLLVCEGLILLFGSLVIGDLLGLGIAYGVTLLTDALNEGSGITFVIDYSTLIPGQIGGILSVVIGMILPIARSFSMPLTGRAVKKRKPHRVYSFKPQTYARICVRDAASNSVRTMGIFLLCTLMAAMQLVCLFIGNNSFSDWRTTVVKNKRPDYIVTVPYGMGKLALDSVSDTVAGMPSVSEVSSYKKTDDIFLWFENMNESPILSSLKALDENGIFFSQPNEKADQTGRPYEDPGYVTTLYSVDIEGEMYKKLVESLSEGTIDTERFAAGEQVIMVVPNHIELSGGKDDSEPFTVDADAGMYEALKASGTMLLSLDPGDAEVYNTDNALKCGDEIYFGGVSVSPTDTERLYVFRSKYAEVGGVINSFPDGGIWPFGGTNQGYAIIGSSRLMQGIFPMSATYMSPEDTAFFVEYRKDSEIGAAYGDSFINVYTDDSDSIGETLMELKRFSKSNIFSLENYRDSNTALYSKAASSCMIILLLAVAVTLIAWLILYNTMTSAEEQGRKKTGILQAIGVDNGRILRARRIQAAIYAAASLITANILLAAVVVVTGAISRAGMAYGFFDMLKSISLQELGSFPWTLYLIINASMLPILLIITGTAVKIPLSHSPIENIRS